MLGYQYSYELNYQSTNVLRGVILMPNYQYIRQPSGPNDRSNISVWGLRAPLSF